MNLDAEVETLRPETLLKFTEGFIQPSANEVRLIVKLSGKTGSILGNLLGVDSRTIRRWTGGEREIPYTAWRLMLLLAEKIHVQNII